MKLIVGLGNPGNEYDQTRHNLGKNVVRLFGGTLKDFKSVKGCLIAKKTIHSVEVLLALPLSFMNESGVAIQALASYYKINPEDIIMVYDDLDLPFGSIRVSRNESSGGHKGVQSAIDRLGSNAFIRVRMGIGPQTGKAEDYVLERFTKEQESLLPEIYTRTQKAIEMVVRDGLEKTAPTFD